MVVIRLARFGAKKAPFYRIVAADRRARLGGKFIEILGFYDPQARGSATRLSVNKVRVDHWVSQGGQPSGSVARLLRAFKNQETRFMKAAESRKGIRAQSVVTTKPKLVVQDSNSGKAENAQSSEAK